MICKELTRYIDAFLDDELSVLENLRVQAHLALCGNCRAVVKSEVTLRNLIAADALQDMAPDHLRERILREIHNRPQPEPSRPFRLFALRWPVFFAGLMVGVVVVGLVVSLADNLFEGSPASFQPLVAEMVGKHQVYSRDEENLHMRSSDPVAVGSWLGERLALPLRLPQLARPGEKLVGARISSIADEQAAYLLYKMAGRLISLYIFKALPADLLSGSSKLVAGTQFFASTLGGFRVVWWEDQELYYAAISDSGANDLIEFGLLCVKGKQA